MSAPICQFCAAEPMKLVIAIPSEDETMIALYQCDQCKRVAAQVE